VGSRIGNATSCYSLHAGEHLYVLDAGRGLLELSHALEREAPLRAVRHVHVLITHAHVDHWEGLKDAAWMWRPRNGLHLSVLAPTEALETIRRGLEQPGFVPLEVLALGTLAELRMAALRAGERVELPGATLELAALHHYCGVAPARRHLETLGYRLALPGGPVVCYLCDHEPTAETQATEDALVAGAHLAILDANFSDIAQHAFGHGSIEYAAALAARHPRMRVLASHHGPMRSDEVIEEAFARHGAGRPNVAIAVEGQVLRWSADTSSFEPA
jgi:phosphoribosyl 1,2-cyclic phosphodiesterase